MSVANYFTFLRIFISPLFPLVYLGYEQLGIPLVLMPYALLAVLMVCEASDMVDGMVARKRHEVTDLGKVLDPMADSITRVSLFFTLPQGMVQLPLMLVLVFLYRDFCTGALRTASALSGIALAARPSGKLKAIVQAFVSFLIVALMIPVTRGWLAVEVLQQVALVSVSIAAGYAVLSAIDYLYANRHFIQKVLTVGSSGRA